MKPEFRCRRMVRVVDLLWVPLSLLLRSSPAYFSAGTTCIASRIFVWCLWSGVRLDRRKGALETAVRLYTIRRLLFSSFASFSSYNLRCSNVLPRPRSPSLPTDDRMKQPFSVINLGRQLDPQVAITREREYVTPLPSHSIPSHLARLLG